MPINLFAPVTSISGIGPKTEAILNKTGIKTIRDLLYYLPRTYENYATTTKLSEIKPGKVIVRGKISDLKTSHTRRRNLTITEGVIRDESDAIRVIWFNQPYRAKQFDKNKDYYFTGSYDLSHGKYQLTSPSAQLASDIENNTIGGNRYRPIYPVRGAFKSEGFKKIFETLRADFADIPDLLPYSESSAIFTKPGTRAEALFKAHFAENDAEAKAAREYLAYEELFELILAANLNKKENQKLKSESVAFAPDRIKEITGSLKFKLTNAQRLATYEILKDLEKDVPMNRLLQGDVGSGKTIVAGLSAYEVIKAGHQVALLAPTAILASQHAESLSSLLEPFGVKVALLVGSTKHKSELKKKIRKGEIDFVIGTHALLTDDTEFSSLTLCIIDEQHRFGVNQRQKLLEKTVKNTGIAPHLLMMTATPIPRSLQLAIFGDLEVSTLNELPKGRQPVLTKVIREIDFTDTLYPEVRNYLAKKQQVYWICKKITESGQSDAVSVKKQTEKLQKVFQKERIAFLHGRMKPDEKDAIMERFAKGEIDILVSTTVVEVGVNVPNANLMVIMDADGYGLAQLHQLRGRVGRGQDLAKCFLVTGNDEPSRRLKELEKSNDGFYLAEVDLKLRGPGEIYGSLQHGALNLQFASLTDSRLIVAASRDARKFTDVFAKTPNQLEKYPELSSCIKQYQQLTTLN